MNDTSDTSKYRFILQILIIFTGGQEQQSMKEILATLARTSEGGDQLPSYEGLSMSLPNNFNHSVYPPDLLVLFLVRNFN